MQTSLYHYHARVIDAYDGDTITAEFDLGFKISFTEKVRLFGIDTPEIRGEERPEGLIARDTLRKWILGKTVYIQTIKDRKGKYGRYLGIIHLEENGQWININDRLVEEGLAERVEY